MVVHVFMDFSYIPYLCNDIRFAFQFALDLPYLSCRVHFSEQIYVLMQEGLLSPFSTWRIYSRDANFVAEEKFDRTSFCIPQKVYCSFFDSLLACKAVRKQTVCLRTPLLLKFQLLMKLLLSVYVREDSG